MKIGGPRFFQRSVLLAAACILAVVLTACTGKGGGYLPPSTGFTGQASFGFTFSCEKGDLKIELSYNEKSSNPMMLRSPFGIHGIVDVVDPGLESATCIAENSPPDSDFGNQLIFLGRYRLTSGAPAKLSTCPTSETPTSSLCRFEVIVRDNDENFEPSPGDYFSIKLSTSATTPCNSNPPDPDCSQLPTGSVVYTRAGFLAGGNITVK
jgi:hypothetical protein